MDSQPDQGVVEDTPAAGSATTDKMGTVANGDNGVDDGISKDESDETLRHLDAQVQNQDELERNIGREADRLLFTQANERDQARLDKTRAQKEKLQNQIRKTRDEISRPIGTTRRAQLRVEIDRMEGQIHDLDNDIAEIQERMKERESNVNSAQQVDASAAGRLPNETQRDYLIRTGKITPFSRFGLSTHGESATTLQGALLDAEEEPELSDMPDVAGGKPMSHRDLRQPGFATDFTDSTAEEEFDSEQPRKRRRLAATKSAAADDDSSYDEGMAESDVLSELEDEDEDMPLTSGMQKRSRKTKTSQIDDDVEDLRGLDDGKESLYLSRVKEWAIRRRMARMKAAGETNDGDKDDELPDDQTLVQEEMYLSHPKIPDTVFTHDYKIPGDIYPSLFGYQKTGVQWLYELYTQQVGGIIADEMGLGKTVQIIAFLAGLHYSKKLRKPIIVVCPATVMKQWVNEFHRWWPPFRVTILHSSGSGMINIRNEASKEDKLLDLAFDPTVRNKPLTSTQKAAQKMIRPILEEGGVLVTTYTGLQTYAPLLIPVEWDYAILDEGHKIRNPNTAITIYCKELRTPNRIILSGTPMQNNLIELWSLFDFVFPMRLGTLVNFRNQFEIPIRQGGHANASNLQVQTAFKCAETLKEAISPYLLQRFKVDVASDLPKKSEKVVFCNLTPLQRAEYQRFLDSKEMEAIINGRRQPLYGIDILRKICNHPDLANHKYLAHKPGYKYGDPAKSGKMTVVGALLKSWKGEGHKTLLFAQHRIMLDILEKFVKSLDGFKYRRMDGNTPIPLRQSMVDEFNTDPDLHVFLLTTKVGGLGINLTGADRVIIYDPDWNPSTDLQARERAWRLGQKREVTICRLMIAGTIEEKIYHRQIFKQFLTNKILKDPKQRQTFHLNDLHDLFSLGNEGAPTETSSLFKEAQFKYSDKPTKALEPGELKDAKGVTPDTGDTNIKALPGISSVEQYAGEVEEEAKANKEGGTNSEERMMEAIFSRSGIHSAVEHDTIVDGYRTSKTVAADPVLIEQEARKVAAEAAKELKRAGEVARHVPVGTPTWTGQFGVSGRPQETTAQRAFGSSGRSREGAMQSSNLLANLQQRQAQASGSRAATPGNSSPARSTGTAASNSRAGTPTLPQGKDFGKLIRDFLIAHGGAAYTQMLIDHFNRYCRTPQATLEFKETLKLIATLQKAGQGRGRWVLKDEYKK
ncbi:DNA repair and recombination protein RAD26 [Exophiala dermatitidis]